MFLTGVVFTQVLEGLATAADAPDDDDDDDNDVADYDNTNGGQQRNHAACNDRDTQRAEISTNESSRKKRRRQPSLFLPALWPQLAL